MSDYFRDARNISIADSNFNHVEGNQHNHYNRSLRWMTQGATTVIHVNGDQINQYIHQEERQHTEFDDFRHVKRGDIFRLRDIYAQRSDSPDDLLRRRRRLHTVNKTICVAEVDGRQGRVFTVVSYTGPDAREAFVTDFHKYSRAVTSTAAQVYAIDIGTIPSLIFHSELVPVAHCTIDGGVLSRMYLESLRRQWGCREDELWMDLSRGVLCRGPEGPTLSLQQRGFEIGDLPSTADFLQEDILLRFLVSCKSKPTDIVFVKAISLACNPNEDECEWDTNSPAVVSRLMNVPIAVANPVWRSGTKNLVERELLNNGLTRFRLEDGENHLELVLNSNAAECWSSQALSIFHARGISIEDESNLSDFSCIRPYTVFCGYISIEESQLRSGKSIYLVMRPPPPDTSPNYWHDESLHYWSHHEDGRSPLSPESCNDLGLPTTLAIEFPFCTIHKLSWSRKEYELMQRYQTLRGFDPKTREFARWLGFDEHVFEVVGDERRFEEVGDGEGLEQEYSRSQSNGGIQPTAHSDNASSAYRSKSSTSSSNPPLSFPLSREGYLHPSKHLFKKGWWRRFTNSKG
ncbi:hypothetical protein PM082_006372 [Marasmius tenuissimus]|nr:hypothetical protein PM082_006372 [Marasmius tenuissimus]